MAKIAVVRSANVALVKSQPLVAVFIAGTGGIGENTVRALAADHAESQSGQSLRIYIVGRNQENAQRIQSDCGCLCPSGTFHFVQAEDLSLLKNVDRVCAEVTSIERHDGGADGREPRIDILVLSHGGSIFEGRNETTEGLDRIMSRFYYSRMRFILNFLPLLLASSLPAHVISVFAAGMEAKLFPDDLSLRDPTHQSYSNVRSHVVYMTTLFFETLAQKYPGKLALTHVFPGLVDGPNFLGAENPLWFRLLWGLFIRPLTTFYRTPREESGQRVLFLTTPRFSARDSTRAKSSKDLAIATDGQLGGGAYSVGQRSETNQNQDKYTEARRLGLQEKVWRHTTTAFETIEVGKVFTK